MCENVNPGILYCYMFNENKGSYATKGENIVHETINFFRDDKDVHYLYIPNDGKVNRSAEIDYVIISERAGNNIAKIKYLAKVDQYNSKDELKGGKIEYGGQPLEKIFNRNIDKDKEDIVYVNFIVTELYIPSKPIIIYTAKSKPNKEVLDNCNAIILNNINTRKMFMYYIYNSLKEDKKNDYNSLLNVINDKDKWVTADSMIKRVSFEEPIYEREETFFNIIKQGDNELAFSNMFKYFFLAKTELLIRFIKNLNKQIELKDNITVKREHNNIDIYITDGTEHIIIENKIKSEINYTDEKSQLQKYVEVLLEQDIDQNKIHCFLFKPDYHTFDDCELEIKTGKTIKKYIPVNYSTILDFYKKNERCFKENEKQYMYLQIFLEAMKKHTRSIDKDIEDRMKARFINRINELNGEPQI